MGVGTSPVFIIGSGRSGTRALFKALSQFERVEVHHEYCCTHIQPVAAKFFMERASRDDVLGTLRALHGAAISLSPADVWIDSSNKLTWVIDPLMETFPTAKIVNVVRDGRKVAASYVKKLGDEMYDDASVKALMAWLSDPTLPEPPPEKRYWWNIPQPGQPFHEAFPTFNQLQRAAYHWVESNRVAREALDQMVPPSQSLTLRLEDLVADQGIQERLIEFIGVPWKDSFARALEKPQNVIVPIDYQMTTEELSDFAGIASEEMATLGYDLTTPEYKVVY